MHPPVVPKIPKFIGKELLFTVHIKYFILKGLSHEIDFKNVDENGQILALTRAAAGF
jgi:hypothetical protein